MSWSVNVKGDSGAVRLAFGEQRGRLERNGAPKGELEDLDRAATFAQSIANASAPAEVEVSANGSWLSSYGGAPPAPLNWRFGEVALRVKAVPKT
jgi:hypothetical protein